MIRADLMIVKEEASNNPYFTHDFRRPPGPSRVHGVMRLFRLGSDTKESGYSERIRQPETFLLSRGGGAYHPPMDDKRQKRVGVSYGLAAFLAWGLLPVYFKLVGAVPPLEVLAHRIVWSLLFLLLITLLRGRFREFTALFRDLRTQLTLMVTTCLIATNWGVFIWAIDTGRLVEASLGYFINPLFSVLLGFVFLRERLTRLQTAAVGLAVVSIVWLTVDFGELPWISLLLAVSFGFYGLLRKGVRASGIQGLTAETLMLAPVALGWMAWRRSRGELVFLESSGGLDLLLLAAGPITALPLIWFAEGARRLRLATVGILQYLAPTGQLLLAVLAFGEPFTRTHAFSFGLIWVALILYSSTRCGTAGADTPIEADMLGCLVSSHHTRALRDGGLHAHESFPHHRLVRPAGGRGPRLRRGSDPVTPQPDGSRGPALIDVGDGDTVVIQWSDEDRERVRILGIDTPEVAHPSMGWYDDQPYGEQATAFAEGVFAMAESVELLRAAEPDGYGRTLGYLFVNGRNYSILAVTAGYAVETVSHYGDNGLPRDRGCGAGGVARVGPVAFEAPFRFRRRMRELNEWRESLEEEAAGE